MKTLLALFTAATALWAGAGHAAASPITEDEAYAVGVEAYAA